MPTFSRSLEKALHRALALANERRHEFATLEHLLLSLTDDKGRRILVQASKITFIEIGAADKGRVALPGADD